MTADEARAYAAHTFADRMNRFATRNEEWLNHVHRQVTMAIDNGNSFVALRIGDSLSSVTLAIQYLSKAEGYFVRYEPETRSLFIDWSTQQ